MATVDKINVPDFERPIKELEIRLDKLTNTQYLSRNDDEKEAREAEIASLKKEVSKMIETTYGNLRPWHVVQLARHPRRPLFSDHVAAFCDDWTELHGDRAYGDDPAIACGFASIGGHKVMLMGHRK